MKMQEDENRRLNQALEDAVQGLQLSLIHI